MAPVKRPSSHIDDIDDDEDFRLPKRSSSQARSSVRSTSGRVNTDNQSTVTRTGSVSHNPASSNNIRASTNHGTRTNSSQIPVSRRSGPSALSSLRPSSAMNSPRLPNPRAVGGPPASSTQAIIPPISTNDEGLDSTIEAENVIQMHQTVNMRPTVPYAYGAFDPSLDTPAKLENAISGRELRSIALPAIDSRIPQTDQEKLPFDKRLYNAVVHMGVLQPMDSLPNNKRTSGSWLLHGEVFSQAYIQYKVRKLLDAIIAYHTPSSTIDIFRDRVYDPTTGKYHYKNQPRAGPRNRVGKSYYHKLTFETRVQAIETALKENKRLAQDVVIGTEDLTWLIIRAPEMVAITRGNNDEAYKARAVKTQAKQTLIVMNDLDKDPSLQRKSSRNTSTSAASVGRASGGSARPTSARSVPSMRMTAQRPQGPQVAQALRPLTSRTALDPYDTKATHGFGLPRGSQKTVAGELSQAINSTKSHNTGLATGVASTNFRSPISTGTTPYYNSPGFRYNLAATAVDGSDTAFDQRATTQSYPEGFLTQRAGSPESNTRPSTGYSSNGTATYQSSAVTTPAATTPSEDLDEGGFDTAQYDQDLRNWNDQYCFDDDDHPYDPDLE